MFIQHSKLDKMPVMSCFVPYLLQRACSVSVLIFCRTNFNALDNFLFVFHFLYSLFLTSCVNFFHTGPWNVYKVDWQFFSTLWKISLETLPWEMPGTEWNEDGTFTFGQIWQYSDNWGPSKNKASMTSIVETCNRCLHFSNQTMQNVHFGWHGCIILKWQQQGRDMSFCLILRSHFNDASNIGTCTRVCNVFNILLN